MTSVDHGRADDNVEENEMHTRICTYMHLPVYGERIYADVGNGIAETIAAT